MKLDQQAYERHLAEARARLGLAVVFNPMKHPRGFGGRFSETANAPAPTAPAQVAEVAPQANAPATDLQPQRAQARKPKPLMETPSAPPIAEWVDPPAPQGKNKGSAKPGGFSATGKTNTEIGDLGEKLVEQLDLKSLLPPGKRQNPLDAEYDHTGFGFEIKTMTTAATQYRIKMKAHEVESKNAYAQENGMKPGLMAVILDADKGTAHVYWREGIKNVSMSTPGWNHLAVVSLNEGQE